MKNKFPKIIYFLLCFTLIFEQSGFAQVAGQLDISGYLGGLRNALTQDKFRPLHLRYLDYDSLSNNFKLLLDKGDFMKGLSPEGLPVGRQGAAPEARLKEETQKLMQYFFIGLSLPNDSFWVNLRPDSPDNVIDPFLAQTDLGKVLLEADLQLKKDTASFTSPQTPEGRDYWNKLYQKANELFANDNVTIPTLTRPWIVPDEIIVRQTQGLSSEGLPAGRQGTVPVTPSAYIYKATLKVMLEQDYLKGSSTYNFDDDRLKQLNEYASELLRKTIIPKLTKDVNTAKRYAPLRQAYYSLILAHWFKQRFRGLSSQAAKGLFLEGAVPERIDSRNLAGLTSKEAWSKDTYFKAYQKSFKEGEYNIREPIQTPQGRVIRTYMSGGIDILGPSSVSAFRDGLIISEKKNLPDELKADKIVADFDSLKGNLTISNLPEDEAIEPPAPIVSPEDPADVTVSSSPLAQPSEIVVSKDRAATLKKNLSFQELFQYFRISLSEIRIGLLDILPRPRLLGLVSLIAISVTFLESLIIVDRDLTNSGSTLLKNPFYKTSEEIFAEKELLHERYLQIASVPQILDLISEEDSRAFKYFLIHLELARNELAKPHFGGTKILPDLQNADVSSLARSAEKGSLLAWDVLIWLNNFGNIQANSACLKVRNNLLDNIIKGKHIEKSMDLLLESYKKECLLRDKNIGKHGSKNSIEPRIFRTLKTIFEQPKTLPYQDKILAFREELRFLKSKDSRYRSNLISSVIDSVVNASDSAQELEEISAMFLQAERLRINFLNRFSLNTLKEIVNNRELNQPDDRALVVVIYPKSDYNNAFEVNGLNQYPMDKYRLMYYEVSTSDEMLNCLKDATKDQKATIIHLGGHGDQFSLNFGDDDLSWSDYDKLYQARIYQALVPKKKGRVIVEGCSTGKGEKDHSNLANMLRRLFPQAKVRGIYAPVGPTRSEKIIIDDSGEIIDVEFDVGTYHARLEEFLDQVKHPDLERNKSGLIQEFLAMESRNPITASSLVSSSPLSGLRKFVLTATLVLSMFGGMQAVGGIKVTSAISQNEKILMSADTLRVDKKIILDAARVASQDEPRIVLEHAKKFRHLSSEAERIILDAAQRVSQENPEVALIFAEAYRDSPEGQNILRDAAQRVSQKNPKAALELVNKFKNLSDALNIIKVASEKYPAEALMVSEDFKELPDAEGFILNVARAVSQKYPRVALNYYNSYRKIPGAENILLDAVKAAIREYPDAVLGYTRDKGLLGWKEIILDAARALSQNDPGFALLYAYDYKSFPGAEKIIMDAAKRASQIDPAYAVSCFERYKDLPGAIDILKVAIQNRPWFALEYREEYSQYIPDTTLGEIIKKAELMMEEIQPLFAKAKEFNIEFPKRFNVDQLKEVIRNRELNQPDGRALLVVIYPKSDYNQAFENGGSLSQYPRDKYRIMYYEASTSDEMLKYLKEATKEQKAAIIHLGGHGSPDSLRFGSDVLDFTDEDTLRQAGIFQTLLDEGQVILEGCRTGEKGASNLANMMRRLFPQAKLKGIHSPIGEPERTRFIIDDSGEIIDVKFDVDTYHARLEDFLDQIKHPEREETESRLIQEFLAMESDNSFASSSPISSSPVQSSIAEVLQNAITKGNGKIPTADFMKLALYDPDYGYYTTQASINWGLDFSTAAGDPMFGVDIARQMHQMWELMGKARKFTIVETGAGNGDLAKSIIRHLRAKSSYRDFYDALEYVIVDVSPSLKLEQQGNLSDFTDKVKWVQGNAFDLSQLKDIEGVFLSNELPDAFPVHRVRAGENNSFQEVYVTFKDGQFQDQLGDISDPKITDYINSLIRQGVEFAEGTEIAVNLGLEPWQREMAKALKRGYIITIDYGGSPQEIATILKKGGYSVVWGGAVIRLNIKDIYTQMAKGNAVDITSGVDFNEISRLGKIQGLNSIGATNQLNFMSNIQGWGAFSNQEQFKVLIQGKNVDSSAKLIGLTGPAEKTGLSSSPVELNDFINITPAMFDSLISSIEKIRGKILNEYEKQRLNVLKDALDELQKVQAGLKESKLGYPLVCYQAAKGASAVLTRYGFRHTMVSNVNPLLRTEVPLANFIKLNLAGVELVLDLVNEQYAGKDTGIVLIPSNIINLTEEGSPAYKYVYAYKWPAMFEAKVDGGKIKECTIRTFQEAPADIVTVINPYDVEWAMTNEDKNELYSYVVIKPAAGKGDLTKVIMIRSRLGEPVSHIKLIDILPEDDSLSVLKFMGADTGIAADEKLSYLIDIPNKRIKGSSGGKDSAWFALEEFFSKELINRDIGASSPLSGPFRAGNEDLFIFKASGRQEMSELLQEWFNQDENRTFSREQWNRAVDFVASGNGFMIKMESTRGKIASLGIYVKKPFPFAGGNTRDVYYAEYIETDRNYTDNGVAEFLTAKAAETILREGRTAGDMVMVSHPREGKGWDEITEFHKKLGFREIDYTNRQKVFTDEDDQQKALWMGLSVRNAKDLIKRVSQRQVYNKSLVDLPSFTPQATSSPVVSEAASSSVTEKQENDKGGIDFRALPIVTQTGLNSGASLGKAVSGALSSAQLEESLLQARNMLDAGIMPSNERIKEYIQACCASNAGQERDKVLSCIADMLRLQEEQAVRTDAQLKEMLVLLESGNPASQMQIILTKIMIEPNGSFVKGK